MTLICCVNYAVTAFCAELVASVFGGIDHDGKTSIQLVLFHLTLYGSSGSKVQMSQEAC